MSTKSGLTPPSATVFNSMLLQHYYDSARAKQLPVRRRSVWCGSFAPRHLVTCQLTNDTATLVFFSVIWIMMLYPFAERRIFPR